MDAVITIPQPQEIRQRIDMRRREIAELKRVLRLSQAATAAKEIATETERKESARGK